MTPVFQDNVGPSKAYPPTYMVQTPAGMEVDKGCMKFFNI